MININKFEISITRGDSGYISFDLKNKLGQDYTLSARDVVKCQVRDQVDGNLLFEGKIERNGDDITWHIYPEDTKELSVGTYYWDAEVRLVNGDVYSFVPVSKINILPDITIDED